MASTASLMSAAFLRTAPVRWGMSISSQLCSTRARRAPAKQLPSATAPHGPVPPGDVDQLAVVLDQGAAVAGEQGPVGIGPPGHHPAPLGQGVEDRADVEPPADLPGPDDQVLMVDEQGDACFLVGHGP